MNSNLTHIQAAITQLAGETKQDLFKSVWLTDASENQLAYNNQIDERTHNSQDIEKALTTILSQYPGYQFELDCADAFPDGYSAWYITISKS